MKEISSGRDDFGIAVLSISSDNLSHIQSNAAKNASKVESILQTYYSNVGRIQIGLPDLFPNLTYRSVLEENCKAIADPFAIYLRVAVFPVTSG